MYSAQASGALRAVADAIERAAATGGNDTDVLYVGSSLAMDESAARYPPGPGAWHARIPLPWYTEAAHADVQSVRRPAQIDGQSPPVVITTVKVRAAVAKRLGRSYTGRRYLLDDVGDRTVVVFRRRDLFSRVRQRSD